MINYKTKYIKYKSKYLSLISEKKSIATLKKISGGSSRKISLDGENHCLTSAWKECLPDLSDKERLLYQSTPPKNRIDIFGFTNSNLVYQQIDEFQNFIYQFLNNKSIKHSWLDRFCLKKQELGSFITILEELNNLKKSIVNFSDPKVLSTFRNQDQNKQIDYMRNMQLETFDIFNKIVNLFEYKFIGEIENNPFIDFKKKIEQSTNPSEFGSYFCSIWYDIIPCNKKTNLSNLISIGFFINDSENFQVLMSHAFLLLKSIKKEEEEEVEEEEEEVGV